MNEMTTTNEMTISFSMHMILFQEPTCYMNDLNLLYDDMNTFLLCVHASFSETNMLNEWYYEHLSPLSAILHVCVFCKKRIFISIMKKSLRSKKSFHWGLNPNCLDGSPAL